MDEDATPWVGLRQKQNATEPAGDSFWLDANHNLTYPAIQSVTPWRPSEPENAGVGSEMAVLR